VFEHTEDCCWNDIRNRCPLTCSCACHATSSKRMSRREWESIKIADFERLESQLAAAEARIAELTAAGIEPSAERALVSSAEAYRLVEEARQMRAARDAAEARIAALRDALATIVGAFVSGVYCAHCGESIDDCDCIVAVARAALAAGKEG
jgi:hypothetical protein